MIGIPETRVGKKRYTYLLRAISCCFALWMASLPLLQFIHITFASHDHSYCLEHRQFEDVERDSKREYDRAKILVQATQGGVFELNLNFELSPFETHIACSVLNNSASRDPFIQTEQATHHLTQENCGQTGISGTLPFIPTTLIDVAPKTSPPQTSA